MSQRTVFQICQDGNLAEMKAKLDLTTDLDINGKDESGISALAYAARNGHVDVVRELISRGASTVDIVQQGPIGHSEIDDLLRDGDKRRLSGSNSKENHHDPSSYYSTDEQFYNGQPSMQQTQEASHFPNGLVAHEYYPNEGQMDGQAFFIPGMSPTHPSFGHQRTDSNTNMPPPEVARMIPCRFFPNCRYGDQCMFAHPIVALPTAPLLDGAPLSPTLNSPPLQPPHPQMQPVFYQPIPQGYPYPAPYAPFYPSHMGPSSMLQQSQYLSNGQYTSSANQQSIQFHSQQNHDSQFQHTSDNNNTAISSQDGGRKETTSVRQNESDSQSAPVDIPSAKGNENQDETIREAIDTHSQDYIVPNVGPEEGIFKAAHRRQSFNSFLQYHAIPFQPNGPAQAAINGNFMYGIGGMQSFTPNRFGPKSKRIPNGINGFGKRNHGDRPACTFFAGGRCKYGDECRFPHILADGSDARSVQAQQRTLTDMHHVSTSKPNHESSVPASTPTGPASTRNEERYSSGRIEKDHQHSAPGSQYKKTSPSLQSGQMNGHANGIVRSIPSRTSKQDTIHPRSQNNGTSSTASTKKHQNVSRQPVQRIPTVNDFPALTVASPNVGGKDNGEFQSADRNGLIKFHSTESANVNGSEEHVTKESDVDNGNVNGHSAPVKANFSAILSAPAPVKTRASSADSIHETNGKEVQEALNTETSNHTEAQTESSLPDKTLNGYEYSNGSKNGGGSMTSRDGNLEGRNATTNGYRNSSYKAIAAAPPASNKAKTDGLGEDDDFQIVNRSRNINKRGPSAPQHHRPANVPEGYAAHAKAVAA